MRCATGAKPLPSHRVLPRGGDRDMVRARLLDSWHGHRPVSPPLLVLRPHHCAAGSSRVQVVRPRRCAAAGAPGPARHRQCDTAAGNHAGRKITLQGTPCRRPRLHRETGPWGGRCCAPCRTTGDDARAAVGAGSPIGRPLQESILGYADAVAAGREGRADEAGRWFTCAGPGCGRPVWRRSDTSPNAWWLNARSPTGGAAAPVAQRWRHFLPRRRAPPRRRACRSLLRKAGVAGQLRAGDVASQ
jgi:hypothetical protein